MKILEDVEIRLRNRFVATFETESAVHARIELL